ncbi:LapA family protein [Mycolicibacterium sediminis]|nr:lipopolysaccharide assembly LapA domain-containing protein [Mycolicibacterium sediminis]
MTSDPYVPPADSGSQAPLDPATGHVTPAEPVQNPPSPAKEVKFTRAGALWSALIVGFLVLIVLLIFIAQNTESAVLHFLGWNWSLPLGVSILAAAVLGGLITVLAGAVRIFQLRRAAKKNYKAAIR